MKVTQTIQLDDRERLAIQKVLGMCDEISDIAHCSMEKVFAYLMDASELGDDYCYTIGDTLNIAEIG